jgi:peptide/nickel transport system ATP-binding protein
MGTDAQLEVSGLEKSFRLGGGSHRRAGPAYVHAVRGVSFSLSRGETLGLVGETGCGKSTIARCIVGLTAPTAGSVRFDGTELTTLRRAEWRAVRRKMQIVFQNPYLSLDPKMTVLAIVREPAIIYGTPRDEATELARRTLGAVGLGEGEMSSRPAGLSGGQRQRVAIARALVLNPELVVLDEPVSALDVSIQAQVTNLLVDLQAERGVSYVAILHDLAVASQMCDQVAVIYLGRIVEVGPAETVLNDPVHPYTCGLLDAVPRLGAGIGAASEHASEIRGELTHEVTSGCPFRPRCPIGRERERCAAEVPELVAVGSGDHRAACHFAAEAKERWQSPPA